MAIGRESRLEVHREERSLGRVARGRARLRPSRVRAARLVVAALVIAFGLAFEWAFYDSAFGLVLTAVDFLVDAVRALTLGSRADVLLGHPASYYVARALRWAAAILIVSAPLAVARYRRG
jgi:hypothetical protein